MSTTESNETVVKDFVDGLFTKGDLGERAHGQPARDHHLEAGASW